MLLPVIHVYAGDSALVIDNLRLCVHLDGRVDASALIVTESGWDHTPVLQAAIRAFAHVRVITYDPWRGEKKWPVVQNYAWQAAARQIAELPASHFLHPPSGWLWWESDATPLRVGWLDILSRHHEGDPATSFTGVPMSDSETPFWMNGVGVWPMNCIDDLVNTAALYIRDTPFDREAGRAVRKHFREATGLIIHEVKPFGGSIGHAFETRAEVDTLLATHPHAIFYHGSGDGSLTKLIIGESLSQGFVHNGVGVLLSTQPRFSISILCHNSLDYTRRCIASVLRHSPPDIELIITDNASTDGTHDYLQQLAARFITGTTPTIITRVTNPTNLGFHGPNNHAVTLSRAPVHVMLNNDMEVCPGWLDALHTKLTSDPQISLVGLSNTCQAINSNWRGTPNGPLEYIEGSCLMALTETLKRFGPFAPYLQFAYYEDVDLSLRVREAGLAIAVVDLPMRHTARGTTARQIDQNMLTAHVNANRLAMQRRWAGYFATRSFAPPASILLRRRGANGDVLLLTPVLRALRAKWPNAKLAVATECPSVLTGIVDTVPMHTAVKYAVEYDLDLSYEARPDLHIVQAYAEVCGVEVAPDWKPEIGDGDDAIKLPGPVPYAIAHADTHWSGKAWPRDRWMELQENCGIPLHFITPNQSPQQLAWIIKHASLFIGVDSFPAHVAQAVGTPAVVLFGTTNPACILCPTANVAAVQADPRLVPCVGEHGRRTSAITSAPPCDGACMAAITVDMVADAVGRILKHEEVVA